MTMHAVKQCGQDEGGTPVRAVRHKENDHQRTEDSDLEVLHHLLEQQAYLHSKWRSSSDGHETTVL